MVQTQGMVQAQYDREVEKADRRPTIADEFSSLSEELGVLSDRLGLLATRLDPVLAPPTPYALMGETSDAAPDDRSSWRALVEKLAARVRAERGVVDDLLARVEL